VPYPSDVYTENGYPVVVITPLALATIGKRNNHTAIQQYEASYNQMSVGGGRGWYGSGMINTGECHVHSSWHHGRVALASCFWSLLCTLG
jgi:hypothetical protein